jgi:hypothetical protein
MQSEWTSEYAVLIGLWEGSNGICCVLEPSGPGCESAGTGEHARVVPRGGESVPTQMYRGREGGWMYANGSEDGKVRAEF